MGKGIMQQIEEAGIITPKIPTEKEIREFFKKAEKERIEYNKKIVKLEKEWSKHWNNKRKEFPNEEPPMWLVLKTMPSMNHMTGGIWYTSREIMDKYKKWLQ